MNQERQTCRKCGVPNHENHPATGLHCSLTESTGHAFCSECIRLHGKEALLAGLGKQTALFPEPVSGVF